MDPLLVILLLLVLAAMVAWVVLWNHILQGRVEEKNIRLAESEAFLERLFRQSPYGMWVADTDGTLLMMNDAAERLFGIERPEEVIGVYNVFRDNVLRELDLVDEVRKAFHGETVTLTDRYDPGRVEGFGLASKSLFLRTTFTPIHNRHGEINHILVMHEDITERSRAEHELRDRNRKVWDLIEAFSSLTTTLDPQEVLLRVASHASRPLPQTDWGGFFLYEPETDELRLVNPIGYEREDDELRLPRGAGIAGKVFEEGGTVFLPGPAEVERAVGDLPPGPKEAWNELCGGRRPQSAVGVPLESRGRTLGVLGLVTTDESAPYTDFDAKLLEAFSDHAAAAIDNAYLYEALVRKSQELEGVNRKLQNALDELRVLDEMKTNLLSNVSHELRTPLIAIMGYTDLMLAGRLGPVTDEQRNRLEICLRNAKRLSRRIDDLLNFSRSEMGDTVLEVAQFDLRKVLEEAIESLQTHAAERQVRIEQKLADGEIKIKGDREKILQVFTNLIDNAIKFNDEGGLVRVETRPIGKGLARVNVIDTGIGIPDDAKERIFDRFYQVDASVSRPYGGTGIGLSLVQSIVNLHGGRIRVKSKVGEGSTFTVVLPVYDASKDSGRYEVRTGKEHSDPGEEAEEIAAGSESVPGDTGESLPGA